MTQDTGEQHEFGGVSRFLADNYVYGPLAIAAVNGSIAAYEVYRGGHPTGYLNATLVALFWFGTLIDSGGEV